ncbi:Deoxyguanosine kinase [Mycoplasmopsis californica]|uniref:Deoxynucleoside kinase n=1 Tax=Mycoplasmopsis equigenitalium TaxID=114883 RepID=A0ABY5J3C0_9BACT|nr:deoxynucleoside kinase [Mycoplasmopsis equigenitalium]UUD37278.1 deoxynucleoside kinase [Mycoplasmopsis equigenitalium]VEU69413.1 Deoxyguanosine kinase [Mycoplasmopsis californica]
MLIGISGMISSGKSTLTNRLVDYFNQKNETWKLDEFAEDDEVFNTFLKWLYEKQPNLTIGFQSYVVENHTTKLNDLLTKFKEAKLDPQKNHIFLDRFSIEHYIFANVILKEKGEKYLKGYDALFRHLITKKETPALAIYLDMSFETFKKRLFSRGREVEIANFETNKEYFQTLYNNYKTTFIAQAQKYNLNYVVIDTNNLNEEQVFKKAVAVIESEMQK